MVEQQPEQGTFGVALSLLRDRAPSLGFELIVDLLAVMNATAGGTLRCTAQTWRLWPGPHYQPDLFVICII